MLRSRIIPCLLIHNGGLTKTVKFKPGKYVGDPLNAVKIFNEKQVDELAVFDIDATINGKDPNFGLIKRIADECRMPLCYGGGISSAEHAKELIHLGVEKIAVSSAAIAQPNLLEEMKRMVGLQSVVFVMDVKKVGLFKKNYEVFTHNGTRSTGISAVQLATQVEKIGVGEVVINNIDNDGEMRGYDLKLIDEIRSVTSMPLTALGGAGSYDDLRQLVLQHKIIGAAAGSIFVFKGKYKAVLIQYPDGKEKEAIYAK
jgi:cyclase